MAMATIIVQSAPVRDHRSSPSRRVRGQRRQYTCAYCAKVFKRSEHCIRHERTHTNEKPFSCRYCRRAYSRKDLVTRHERTIHAHGQGEASLLPGAAIQAEGEGLSDDASESGASPASSMIGTAAVDSPSDAADAAPVPIGDPEPLLSQPPVPTPDISRTHSVSHQPELYMTLQNGGFDMHDASSQIPMDVDHGINQQLQQPQQTQQQQQQQQQPGHKHGFHQFTQNDGGDLPTFEPDLSFFAFSPLPAGLFDSILEYPPTPTTRFDAPILLTPTVPHPTAYPAAQFSPGLDCSGRSGSEMSVAPEQPNGDLPLLVKGKPPPIPNFVADDAMHASICEDVAKRLGQPEVTGEVPSARLLQRFLTSFFEGFYRHHPCIHLATLSTINTPSPLILAMCCIGALYRLDRRRAQRLYTISKECIAPHVQRFLAKSMTEDCPLWVAQTKVLLSDYAALSGDRDMATSVLDENGFYTLLYGKVRLALAAENSDMNKMTWDSWVRRESWKRLLVGIYIASTLNIIIWDANPNLNTCRDLELEVLHDEGFWNAETGTEWAELRAKQPQQDYRTMRDGLASMLSEGNRADSSPRVGMYSPRLSPLTACLLMHAAIVHTWQLAQVAQALSPAVSLSSLVMGHDSVSSLLVSKAVRSLDRCHKLLINAQNEIAGEPGYEEGTSQIFDCQAILRMAYIRLFNSSSNGCFNRPSLIALDDPATVNAFVSTFSITKQQRSPQLLDAVVKAFDGLKIPVRIGHMLVRKTAALRWSPAHAIAGWDCALFVCKWVHSVEMDRLNGVDPSPAEYELLALMMDVLEEAEYDAGRSKSLAAGVARTWSWLLQDVWVWSITPRMGAILEQMATAFERVNDANQRSGA